MIDDRVGFKRGPQADATKVRKTEGLFLATQPPVLDQANRFTGVTRDGQFDRDGYDLDLIDLFGIEIR